MVYYKLEVTYRTIPTAADRVSKRKTTGRRTYNFFFKSYSSLSLQIKESLRSKATVKVKQISEDEYVGGTR